MTQLQYKTQLQLTAKRHKQNGVALIQAIVFSAILSTIALYLNESAQSNVRSTQLLADKSRALVNYYSAEGSLLFKLLTEPHENSSSGNSALNFFARPIDFERNTVVTIQDLAGLLPTTGFDETTLANMIQNWGYSRSDSTMLIAAIKDWQDADEKEDATGTESGYQFGPRNQPFPEVGELSWLSVVPSSLRLKLIPYFSVFHPGYFNPVNAPEDILKGFLDEPELPERVVNFRNGESVLKRFTDVTGLDESEGIYFYTSPLLRLRFNSYYGDSGVARQLTLRLDPYAERPEGVIQEFERSSGQRALISNVEDGETN